MKLIGLFFSVVATFAATSDRSSSVHLLHAPNGGIQPQAAVDRDGTVHLIYFSGDPKAGNLFYVRSTDNGATFSKPLQVNSHPGTAIAVGNIRGAHIALGNKGRVHVAWNASKGPNAPMWYTRMNDSRAAFEPERNLIHSAYGLDGGGSLTADAWGNVFVFWHAPEPGAQGEAHRHIWMAKSSDEGRTFDEEHSINATPTGACGCCGMAAFSDSTGGVYALYRSASEVVNRDMYLLASHDHGKTFSDSKVDAWKVGYCVMSSSSFAAGHDATFAAWETKDQIYFGRIDPRTGTIPKIIAASGDTPKRKHPALAVNNNGEILLAWTEGMGWNKGGSLAWQVYDKNGKPTAEAGHADGVPVWSLLTAFTRPDGSFTIVY